MTRLAMDRALAVSEKPLIPSDWSQFDDIEASFYARQRPAPAPAPAPVPIAVNLQPVETIETRFPLPYNPPRYEKGKEISRWIPCLKVTCGPRTYRVIKKTDGGRIMAIAHKLRRVATLESLENFIETALEYIDEKPTAPERPAPSLNVTASGICNRFRKGAFEEQRIIHRPANRPDWHNDLQTANDWTE